jgi:hypothetical protein
MAKKHMTNSSYIILGNISVFEMIISIVFVSHFRGLYMQPCAKYYTRTKGTLYTSRSVMSKGFGISIPF